MHGIALQKLHSTSPACSAISIQTRSSATAETARDADDTAIQGRRGIYDFLLALSSNLAFIFNRSWDITPSLRINITSFFQVELEKTAGIR